MTVTSHQLRALAAVLVLLAAGAARAADLTGKVSIGVKVDDPTLILDDLGEAPRLGDDDALFVSWTMPLDGSADTDPVGAIRDTGARPWVRVVFETPAPLIEHLDTLETELAALATIARATGDDVSFQAIWRPEGGGLTASDLAYLIKRAAVVVTGAAPGAGFSAGPLPSDPAVLEWLYVEEVAAYMDVLVLAPGDTTAAAMESLATLDPGKPVVLDAVDWHDPASSPLAEIAEWAAAGAALVFVQADPEADVDLRSLKVAARELNGNLVFDPGSVPDGASGAWAFVREDLALRVVATRKSDAGRLRLVFSDGELRAPELVDLTTGEVRAVTGVRKDGDFVVVVEDAPEVVLLRLERPSAADLAGFDQEIEVGGGHEMPVEEILRRLQAFEDDQDRRLRHYQATRTFSLRFQGQQGSIDVSYSGEFFYRDREFDWVWSDFYIAGVKWRSRKMPKVPLIQPEKVATLPTDIKFAKYYNFRLRGTDVVDGRDCWVLDFKPIEAAPGRSLYQGTVWVDREVYTHVRTRAVQVGLEGEVLSNEEIYHYSPVDEHGQPTEWSRDAFVLPLRISGQQVFSLLNATVPVEFDNRYTDIRINGDDFDANREAALASDATMVRDTDEGLRYLNKEKNGERVVETDPDSSRLFLVGGVFWDESVDYPIPGIGINYLDFDFKNTGAQVNAFFAGAFLSATIADPDFFGSRWNAGANLDGLFFKSKDELYRDGVVVPQEEVKRRGGNFGLSLGRPLAKFFSLEMGYRLRYRQYFRTDETAADFILPLDTFTHVVEASLDYNRSGYRVAVEGDVNRRADWEFWGLPGNTDYDPDQQQYERWQLTVAKTWWLKDFHKIGLVLEYLDSSDTDRFSGYDFGIFGDVTVGGYPSGLVRAEKAMGGHLSGGINVFEIIRATAGVDAMWATNRATGLDNELLAGISIGGTVTLPWQLIMNFDAGYALTGPGKGDIAVRVFFLKLFPGS
jgi:hypothetical protein